MWESILNIYELIYVSKNSFILLKVYSKNLIYDHEHFIINNFKNKKLGNSDQFSYIIRYQKENVTIYFKSFSYNWYIIYLIFSIMFQYKKIKK